MADHHVRAHDRSLKVLDKGHKLDLDTRAGAPPGIVRQRALAVLHDQAGDGLLVACEQKVTIQDRSHEGVKVGRADGDQE